MERQKQKSPHLEGSLSFTGAAASRVGRAIPMRMRSIVRTARYQNFWFATRVFCTGQTFLLISIVRPSRMSWARPSSVVPTSFCPWAGADFLM